MSDKDFNDIIAIKCGISSITVKRVWNNIKKLIVSELQNNSYIRIENFGKFELIKKGGKDEWFENQMGIQEQRYVEPFDFVEFSPSANFINSVNNGLVDSWSKYRFENDELTTYDKILLDIETDLTVDEVLFDLLNKKKKRQIKEATRNKLYQQGQNLGKTELTKGKPIRCVTNGVEYKSVYSASQALNIRAIKMYQNFNKGIFLIDGYEFEFINEIEEKNSNDELW
ncbi:MAG: HU family DNA-binding protein [Malacoplasma sp.]